MTPRGLSASSIDGGKKWEGLQKVHIKPMNKKVKTIFLDRDGVINLKALEGEYIKSWKEFHFLRGVIDAIRLLNDNNYRVIIITNQRGIARHLMTMQDLHVIHSSMEEVLQRHGAHIDGIYVCPHEKGTCHCRKPDIGLFLQAEQDFPIDKSKSWMIGDSKSDIEAGRNYGIRTIAVANFILLADKQFPDLLNAVHFLINR